jgi:hypothetical protein
MKSRSFHTFAPVALLALTLVVVTASAQMRPECGADPSTPGACFAELEDEFNAAFSCGTPTMTENLNEGVFAWFGISGENDFTRDNPDGTRFVHQSDDEVDIAAYCTWPTILSGRCVPGSEDAFFGNARVEANGIVSVLGGAQCPFIVAGLGELTRTSDGKTIQVRPTFHLVRDSAGGCALKRCEILQPGNRNDDEEP